MMRQRYVRVLPQARQDIDDQFAYFAEEDTELAYRFFDAVNEAFDHIAEFPLVGSPRETGNPLLAGLRMWSVPSFKKHLIFYLPDGTIVRVVRVLHGARDIAGILARETARGDA